MRTLILGLGNPQFVEEHMGLLVARGLYTMLRDPDVDIIEAPASDMNIFEVAAGYDKVVVVDCIQGGDGDVGELNRLGLSDLELGPGRHTGRDTEYRASVELDSVAGVVVPLEISIYAIEMGPTSRSVIVGEIAREAVPRLVAEIAREEFGTLSPESEWL
jgi:hydrogenase maturation protease